ncbi:MAG: hypothetical protein U1E87_08315 [Alphaproteobacteria bacterium]
MPSIAKHITEHARVAAIPMSAFYVDKPKPRPCASASPKPEVLDGAIARLKAVKA